MTTDPNLADAFAASAAARRERRNTPAALAALQHELAAQRAELARVDGKLSAVLGLTTGLLAGGLGVAAVAATAVHDPAVIVIPAVAYALPLLASLLLALAAFRPVVPATAPFLRWAGYVNDRAEWLADHLAAQHSDDGDAAARYAAELATLAHLVKVKYRLTTKAVNLIGAAVIILFPLAAIPLAAVLSR